MTLKRVRRETLRRLHLAQAGTADGLGSDGGGDGAKRQLDSGHILVGLLMDSNGGRMQEELFCWEKNRHSLWTCRKFNC